jgi:hypothetical protein
MEKSRSIVENPNAERTISDSKEFNQVKLPSIITKLCSDLTSSGYFELPSLNNTNTKKLHLVNKSLSSSTALADESDILPKIKRLPKVKPNLTKSMSRLERSECMDFMRSYGLQNGDEEAFYDTTHRFLKRTPFYVETKDHIRKCQSEDLYRKKCERREKRHADKPVLKDVRFENLIDALNVKNK